MSAVAQRTYVTPEEYLAKERQAERRSEYVDGVIYAMAGGSRRHSLIAGNVLTELNLQLKQTSCRVYGSDLKVCVPSRRSYFYPDLTVACEESEAIEDEKHVLANPLLLVEVLSKRTRGFDKGKKFLFYQEIDSFREYLLIYQDEPLVERYTKQPDGLWLYTKSIGLDQSVELTTINCRLALQDIYAKTLV